MGLCMKYPSPVKSTTKTGCMKAFIKTLGDSFNPPIPRHSDISIIFVGVTIRWVGNIQFHICLFSIPVPKNWTGTFKKKKKYDLCFKQLGGLCIWFGVSLLGF